MDSKNTSPGTPFSSSSIEGHRKSEIAETSNEGGQLQTKHNWESLELREWPKELTLKIWQQKRSQCPPGGPQRTCGRKTRGRYHKSEDIIQGPSTSRRTCFSSQISFMYTKTLCLMDPDWMICGISSFEC